MNSIQWGTVGEWFGAIMAGAAVIWAVWIASRERRDRESAEAYERKAQERAERAEEREVAALTRERQAQELAAREREEAQARRVVGWLSVQPGRPDDKEEGDELHPLVIREAFILNGSDAPVFNFRALHVPVGDGRKTPLYEEDVLPPGPARSLGRRVSSGAMVVQFKDAGGRWWQRGLNGDLRSVTEDALWAP